MRNQNAAAKETNDITAEFQHVRVNLGKFFSEMMMPVFDFINETSKPALPIFKILDARQPILSDIPILNDLLNADKDNAKDVSIIDVIRTASDYGLIPEGMSFGLVTEILPLTIPWKSYPFSPATSTT